MAAVLQQIGWTGFMPHFRGCSGELNRLPRAYHSGDSAEIDWILRHFNNVIHSAPTLLPGFPRWQCPDEVVGRAARCRQSSHSSGSGCQSAHGRGRIAVPG